MQYQMCGKGEYRFVLKTNENQKYTTLFDKSTGLFIRKEHEGYEEPFWAINGPELLDISITNYCENMCGFCYRESSKKGVFISLTDYEYILRQASEISVLQIALGGGNPNYHPEFCKLLKMTRDNYGIVPSYTTNGVGLNSTILENSKNYCGAVALSAYYDDETMKSLINYIISFNIKLNIHYLLTSNSISRAINWLSKPPSYLKEINALVFLNYKPVGRIIDEGLLLKQSSLYAAFFDAIRAQKYHFKIGFDSCSISWLVKNLELNDKYIEPCEAARFSAFIDEKLNFVPCSFHKIGNTPNLRNNSLLDVWQNDKVFVSFRESLINNRCSAKDCFKKCMGGCSIYPSINSRDCE